MSKILPGILLLILACTLVNLPVQAQSGKASASIDSSSVLIGDHIHLQLSYTYPAKALVKWPVFTDTLTQKIDIIEKGKTDSSFSSDRQSITLSQVLTITCFDSGSYAVPPIRFSHKMPGDTTNYISETRPLMLMVNTVAVDTSQAIKEIKAPLSAPLTLMELLPWIGGGLLLAAIITFVIIFIIRRKKKKPLFARAAKPQIPAHVLALQELENLRGEHLWQQGKVKEYHSRLTGIIRSYIEGRYSIDALEMITPGLLDALKKHAGISNESHEDARRILQLADMVKFAKFQPLPDEHDSSHRYAVRFVTETAPIQEAVQEGSNDAGQEAPGTQTDEPMENKENL